MPEREAAIEDAAELGQALARRMVRGTLDEYLAAWREYQCNCVKLSNWVLAALLIYADEPGLREALKGFARDALGPGEYLQCQVSGEWIEVDKVHALTKALVENHLKGWKDWRQADNPLAWIASVARSIGLEMATEDASLGQERQTVNGQQNQVSKQIYADKHNAVTRPTPRTEVGARRENQQDRIANGVQSGRLNAGQTARIEKGETAINQQVKADRSANGGKLTGAQRNQVNRQQNRMSGKIYRAKH